MRSGVTDGRLNQFDRETMDAMGRAFDAAWQSLQASDIELASSRFANDIREELASRIIATAQRGEGDMTRLRDDAIAYVLNTDRRKQA